MGDMMDGLTIEEQTYMKKLVNECAYKISLPIIIGSGGLAAYGVHKKVIPKHEKFFLHPRHYILLGIGTFTVDMFLRWKYVVPRFEQQFPGARARIKQAIEAKSRGLPANAQQAQNSQGLVAVTPQISPQEQERLIGKYKREYFLMNTVPVSILGVLLVRLMVSKGKLKMIPGLPPYLTAVRFYSLCAISVSGLTDLMVSGTYARLRLQREMDERAIPSTTPVIPGDNVIPDPTFDPVPTEEPFPTEEPLLALEDNDTDSTLKTYEQLRKDNRMAQFNKTPQLTSQQSPPLIRAPSNSRGEELIPLGRKANGSYGDEGFSKG